MEIPNGIANGSIAGFDVEDEAPGVGSAFLVDGFVYAMVAVAAVVQLVRNCCRYRPWTVQKMLHFLMFVATFARSIFLVLVGLDWCKVLSGEVSTSKCSLAERDLFYILDQVPILAFFAIYALLVQFWAEVYYNAVDKIDVLTGVVKPALRVLIAVVMFLQVLFWIFYASAWRNENSFFTKSQAILNMQMFLIVTTGFIYFGRKAYIELRAVPVELGIRSRKLKELSMMTSVSTQKKQLHDRSSWFIIVVYYALLEIVPSIAVLYFNRRLPPQRRTGGTRGPSPPRSRRLFFADDTVTGNGDSSLRKSLLHS